MGSKKKKTSRRASGRAEPERARSSPRRRSLLLGALVTVVAAAGVVGLVLTRSTSKPGRAKTASRAAPSAHYVGTATCESCHSSQAAEWRKSQHQAAMAERTTAPWPATSATLASPTTARRARSSSATASSSSGRTVRTESSRTSRSEYTFGVEPLQQYLIEFRTAGCRPSRSPGTRDPKEAGGQRWFHLYPRERVGHDDELHWTRPSQNWNYMCADCHSTARAQELRRRDRSIPDDWSEISVGCEACHGPGSRHVTWAADATPKSAVESDSTKGLMAQLDERRGVTWSVECRDGQRDALDSRAHTRVARSRRLRAVSLASQRRSPKDTKPGKPFLDYYRPALLTRPLYHADGQQRDEVYDWGSFLQSRMYAQGVTCSDCHNPHSGKLRADGQRRLRDLSSARQVRRAAAPPSQAGEHGRGVRGLSHADDDVHGGRSAPRSQSSHSAPGSLRQAWHAQRVHELSHDARRALGGGEGAERGTVTIRSGYQRFAQTLRRGGHRIAPARRRSCARSPADADAIAHRARDGARRADGRSAGGAVARRTHARPRTTRVRSSASARCKSSSDCRSRCDCNSSRRCCPIRCASIRIEAVRLLAACRHRSGAPDRQCAFQRASAEFIETQRYNADRAEARVELWERSSPSVGTCAGGGGRAAVGDSPGAAPRFPRT